MKVRLKRDITWRTFINLTFSTSEDETQVVRGLTFKRARGPIYDASWDSTEKRFHVQIKWSGRRFLIYGTRDFHVLFHIISIEEGEVIPR